MGSGASSKPIEPDTLAAFSRFQKEYKKMMMENMPNEAIFERMKRLYLDSMDPHKKREQIKTKRESWTRRMSGNNNSKTKRLNVFSKGLDNTRMDIDVSTDDKSVDCTAMLRKALNTLLFEENSDEELDMVVSVMSRVYVNPDELVIIQGDNGDKFYVVESGTLEFVVNGMVVGHVEDGGHFGELALIYDAPRAASVRAVTSATLWTLGRDDFRNIQAQTSSDSLVRRAKWLQKVPILARLSARQLSLLAGALQAVNYKNDSKIITQGDKGDAFYIVEEGVVICTTNDARIFTSARSHSTELARLTAGDYFGEQALLNDQPRNASVIAVGPVKCLRLDRSDFNSMLGPLTSILDSNGTKRILKMFDFFKQVSELEIEAIVTQFEIVEFLEGDTIFSPKVASDAFYIIKQGAVSLVEYSEKSQKIFSLSTSDYFGAEMFESPTYRSRATAAENVQCLRLTRERMKGTHRSEEMEKSVKDDFKIDAETRALLDIDFNDIIQIGVLGEGSFGKVSMVQVFINEKEFLLALKCMSKAHIIECQQEKHVMREKEILSSIPPHPFIIKLYKTHQNQNYLYMLMELVQGGELFGLLHNEDGDDILDEEAIRFYASNVYLALEHLHKLDIAYRDLKPENLLIKTDGYLKLVDMGFAKKIPFTLINDDGIEETHSRSYTLCGTQEYLAPEFVLNTGHDLGVDYWAFGILIYEMLLGYTPFETEDGDISKLFKNIAFVRTGANKVRFPVELEDEHPEVCDFISRLLHGDPTKRLGVGINGGQEIRNHPWFNDVDWDGLLNTEIDAPYKPSLSGRYDISYFEGDQGIRANDERFNFDDHTDVFEGF